MISGNDKLMEIEEEVENPFKKAKEENSELTRNELMKLPGKELALIAEPKTKVSLNTLQGKPKAYLCDIILDITKENDKPQIRVAQVQSESNTYADTIIDILNSIKKDGKLNDVATQLFRDGFVEHIDIARTNGTKFSKNTKKVILIGAGVFLVADATIGIKNIPGQIKKLIKLVKQKRNKQVVNTPQPQNNSTFNGFGN